jgi:hypothetical protein
MNVGQVMIENAFGTFEIDENFLKACQRVWTNHHTSSWHVMFWTNFVSCMASLSLSFVILKNIVAH